jgi:hypothetical protein
VRQCLRRLVEACRLRLGKAMDARVAELNNQGRWTLLVTVLRTYVPPIRWGGGFIVRHREGGRGYQDKGDGILLFSLAILKITAFWDQDSNEPENRPACFCIVLRIMQRLEPLYHDDK